MRKYFPALFFLLISTSVLANIQFSVGLKSYKINDINDSLTGMSFTLGKQYPLTEAFGAQTAIDLSITGVKYNLSLRDVQFATYKFKEYAYGVKQRFHFNSELGSIQFKPFIDIGLGIGRSVASIETLLLDKSQEKKKSLMYFKYSAGFQLLSSTGVGGELSLGKQHNKDYNGTFANLSFVYTL